MNSAMTAPVLEPVGDAKVALQFVNVEAVLENLICEVTIRQIYRNLEEINIEAVYTFALPLSAALLDMSIKTKTKVFKGTVTEKSKAEDRYEDAITDGDTVIMLEQVEPGLYSMNVGNLQPGEKIEISITYAELYKWQGNSLRFFLPTTIAPRYGDPESVGIQPHQSPEYDLLVDNPFTITVTVLGELADASFHSPSHKLDTTKDSEKAVISLKKGEALMDRDFVINIRSDSNQKGFATVARDIDGHVMLASFQPKFPAVKKEAPRSITVVVDCSGSMNGESIAQARKALYEILELLRPEDDFNVIRFGNHYEMLFPAPVKADPRNLKQAKNLLEIMDADMGGTEIGQAVAAAVKNPVSDEISKELLLITDGEVWGWERVTDLAEKSGFRFFTVGVGNSVSEAFVQSLAEVTGGACELVSPREDMAEKIVGHFKRIYFPRAKNIRIGWPCEPAKMLSTRINTVYDGDTLHAFARFEEKPDGDVILTAKLENGESITQSVTTRHALCPQSEPDLPGTLARMAAACEIRPMVASQEIAALAVKYQLMSQHTNYLALDVKIDSEKANDLPALRKTPQMMAAGWGGMGAYTGGDALSLKLSAPRQTRQMQRMFFGLLSDTSPVRITGPENRPVGNIIDVINRLYALTFSQTLVAWSIAYLAANGVSSAVVQDLTRLKKSGIDEYLIVVVFLYLLAQQDWLKKGMSRSTRRVITKAYKQLPKFEYDIELKIEKIILSNKTI